MTQVIGNRLVRGLASGGNVVTETLNGKTFTRVLDETGKTTLNRVKAFAEEKVGDKFVKTTTKVVQETGSSPKKIVEDKVHDEAGNLLGARKVVSSLNGDKFEKFVSKKQVVNSDIAYSRNFRINGIASYKNFDLNSNVRNIRPSSYSDYIACNNLGLPIPDSCSAGEVVNKSLAEMRRIHLEKAPNLPYAKPEFNLQHLDARSPETNALDELNDLGKYLD